MSVIRKLVMAILILIPSAAQAPILYQDSISNETFQTEAILKKSRQIDFPDSEQYDAKPTLSINAPRKYSFSQRTETSPKEPDDEAF